MRRDGTAISKQRPLSGTDKKEEKMDQSATGIRQLNKVYGDPIERNKVGTANKKDTAKKKPNKDLNTVTDFSKL